MHREPALPRCSLHPVRAGRGHGRKSPSVVLQGSTRVVERMVSIRFSVRHEEPNSAYLRKVPCIQAIFEAVFLNHGVLGSVVGFGDSGSMVWLCLWV